MATTTKHDHDSPEEYGFTFLVATAFSLNYIIGSGFLTIPWAFSETGMLLGAIVLFVLSAFAIVAAVFIVETMARADYVRENVAEDSSEMEESAAVSIRMSTRPNYRSVQQSSDDSLSTRNATNDDIVVGRHKFEMTDLCRKFLGNTGLGIYSAFVVLYFYGTLWAYSTVFANAFDAIFSLGYNTFLLIFAVIVVTLSMLDLTEQVTIQVTMAIWRVVMLTVMVLTIVISSMSDTDAFSNYKHDSSSFLAKVDPSKLYILLPIVTYANIFHHSIPALAHPITDKSQAANVFIFALFVCCSAYLVVGVVVADYFGPTLLPSTNLNWATYVGSPHATGAMKHIASLVSAFVVLFPACDVASAYPLNAITLGNNLLTTMLPGSIDSPHLDRKLKYFFRALASVPPIFGAYCLRDLGKITRYTGVCGFALTFVFPAALAYSSEQFMRQHSLPALTLYSRWYTTRIFQIIIGAFGVFVIVFVLIGNMMGLQ